MRVSTFWLGLLLLSLAATSAQAQHVAASADQSRAAAETLPEEPPAGLPEAADPARAYQLEWELDVPIATIAGALAIGRMIRSHGTAEPAYCIQVALERSGEAVCASEGLLSVDAPVAGRWEPTWATVSDLAVVTLGVAPALLLALDGPVVDALNDLVVVFEAALLATALAAISTKGTERARPFAYGDRAPLGERLGGDSALSFFSGHTAFAFAAASATFWTVQRRHPTGSLRWVVLAGGLAVASLTGVSRVLAGKHFPTDVLAGAAVGVATGTLIPALHDRAVAFSVSAGNGGAALGVTHSF